MKRCRLLGLLAFAMILVQPAQAATNFGARAGLSFISGDAYAGVNSIGGLMGGELTFGVGSLIDIGATVDLSTNGSIVFLGALARSEFSGTGGVFADLEIGMSSSASSTSFGLGAGLGSKLGMIGDTLELLPRVGFRYLPQNGQSGFGVNFMMIFNFAFGAK